METIAIIYQQWNGKLEQQNWTENLRSRMYSQKTNYPRKLPFVPAIESHTTLLNSKPFSDGKFFKKCMLDADDQVCPEHRQKFEEVSLSRRTVGRRIKAIDEDQTSQLKELVPLFQLFLLALVRKH